MISDPPVPGAFDFIRKALGSFEVAIYSSRSHQPGGIEAMQWWLRKHEAEFVGELEFPQHKPSAFVTIDDRAIRFTGEWPSIKELREFKPWNKK